MAIKVYFTDGNEVAVTGDAVEFDAFVTGTVTSSLPRGDFLNVALVCKDAGTGAVVARFLLTQLRGYFVEPTVSRSV